MPVRFAGWWHTATLITDHEPSMVPRVCPQDNGMAADESKPVPTAFVIDTVKPAMAKPWRYTL